jgi:hypothetical protein
VQAVTNDNAWYYAHELKKLGEQPHEVRVTFRSMCADGESVVGETRTLVLTPEMYERVRTLLTAP